MPSFFLRIRRPPNSPPFPSTPLFRSSSGGRRVRRFADPASWPSSCGRSSRRFRAPRSAAPGRARSDVFPSEGRVAPLRSSRDGRPATDRESTRLNSSHAHISYAVFFFKNPAPPEFSPLPLHAAFPFFSGRAPRPPIRGPCVLALIVRALVPPVPRSAIGGSRTCSLGRLSVGGTRRSPAVVAGRPARY